MNIEYKKANDGPEVVNPPVNMIGSEQDMISVIEEVLSEENKRTGLFTGPDPKDYFRVTDGVPAYRLRTFTAGFSVSVVRGKLSRGQFRGMVRAALEWNLSNVDSFQPGAWRPVAVELVENHRQRWTRESTGVTASETSNSPLGADGIPQRNPQRTKARLVGDPRMQVAVAIADVSQQGPIDLVFEREQKRTSSMHRYAESGGKLQYMPVKLRQQRKEAHRIIRDFYELPEDIETRLVELDDELKARAQKLRRHLSVEELAEVLKVPAPVIQAFFDEKPARKAARSKASDDV